MRIKQETLPGAGGYLLCRLIGNGKINHLQGKALRNFERVFLGAPFALEDGIAHDVQGVRAAQATQVDEGHR
jgi:hypothetical protein